MKGFRNITRYLAIVVVLTGVTQGAFAEANEPCVKQVPDQNEGGFTFCVIADAHLSEPVNKDLKAYGSGKEKFLRCISEIQKLQGNDKPDFILMLGDVHPWCLSPKDLNDVKIPIHAVPGNHENRMRKNELRALFKGDFVKENGEKSDYYSFVHKNIRFIGLCDAIYPDHIGYLSSEQIEPAGQCEWLENELSRGEKQKVIFAHIPPEPNGGDRSMFLSRNDSRYLNGLIKEHQPIALFFGHQHSKTHNYQIGRSEIFILRSCCWNINQAPVGFMLVRITPAGISKREIFSGFYN